MKPPEFGWVKCQRIWIPSIPRGVVLFHRTTAPITEGCLDCAVFRSGPVAELLAQELELLTFDCLRGPPQKAVLILELDAGDRRVLSQRNPGIRVLLREQRFQPGPVSRLKRRIEEKKPLRRLFLGPAVDASSSRGPALSAPASKE